MIYLKAGILLIAKWDWMFTYDWPWASHYSKTFYIIIYIISFNTYNDPLH